MPTMVEMSFCLWSFWSKLIHMIMKTIGNRLKFLRFGLLSVKHYPSNLYIRSPTISYSNSTIIPFNILYNLFVQQRVEWKYPGRTSTSVRWLRARSSASWRSCTTANVRPPSRLLLTAGCGPSSDNASKPSWCVLDSSARLNILTSLRGKNYFT